MIAFTIQQGWADRACPVDVTVDPAAGDGLVVDAAEPVDALELYRTLRAAFSVSDMLFPEGRITVRAPAVGDLSTLAVAWALLGPERPQQLIVTGQVRADGRLVDQAIYDRRLGPQARPLTLRDAQSQIDGEHLMPDTQDPATNPVARMLLERFADPHPGQLLTSDHVALVEDGQHQTSVRFCTDIDGIAALLASELREPVGIWGAVRLFDLDAPVGWCEISYDLQVTLRHKQLHPPINNHADVVGQGARA